MPKDIVLSTRALLILLTTVLALWFLVQIGSILLLLFVSLVLTLGLTSLVDQLCEKGLSRSLAVLLTYVVFVLGFSTVFALAIAPMISQTQRFLETLPAFTSAVNIPGLESLQVQVVDSVAKGISTASANILKVSVGVFSNALAAVTILVMTFYFLVDFPEIRKRFVSLFARRDQDNIKKAAAEAEEKIGGWLRGQVVLMFSVGLASFVGLSLIGVDYALSLALIAGFLEIVPMVGPLVSVIPALIVAASISPLTTLLVAVLYLFIQQLENNILVPKVMEKAVGFSPLLTLIAILVGGKLMGVLGALLAIPVTLLFFIITKTLLALDFD